MGGASLNMERKAGYILESKMGNPSFASPVPTLAELQADLVEYNVKLLAAATRSKNAVGDKNKSRKKLQGVLKQLGMYVMYIANGDEAFLTSSGYTLSKVNQPTHISKPSNVTLSNGVSSGELAAFVSALGGAEKLTKQ